jgi:hypothetical protein
MSSARRPISPWAKSSSRLGERWRSGMASSGKSQEGFSHQISAHANPLAIRDMSAGAKVLINAQAAAAGASLADTRSSGKSARHVPSCANFVFGPRLTAPPLSLLIEVRQQFGISVEPNDRR